MTRRVKQYNNYCKYYEKVQKRHYTLDNNGTTIKIQAGLVLFLCKSLDKQNIEYSLVDERKDLNIDIDNINIKLDDEITLRDYQEDSVRAALKLRYGFIKLPTGTGKSEVAATIIREFLNKYPQEAVLYAVPTIKLKKQSIERFAKYGITTNDSFPIETGCVNILCYKSILSADTTKYDYKQRDSIGAYIIDEAHHLSSSKLNKQVHRLHNLRLCIGLSATPFDSETTKIKTKLKELTDKEMNIFGATGVLMYSMDEQESKKQKFITDVEIRVLKNKTNIDYLDANDWIFIKNNILKDPTRAQRVAEYTKHIVQEANLNNVVLLIPEVAWSRQYMSIVYDVFKNEPNTRIFEMYGKGIIVEHTSKGVITLKESEKQQLNKDIANPNIKTIYSATSFFKEGVDIPSIQALINVGAGKGVIPTKQILGRIVRLFKGKNIAYLHEIKDENNNVLLNQFNKRIKIYTEQYKAKVKYSTF